MWLYLVKKDYYLPPFEKNGRMMKCWSEDYLSKLIFDEAYKIQRGTARIAPPPLRKATKEEMIQDIERTSQKPISCDVNLPREWLLNVLYTIEPSHPLFQAPLSPRLEFVRKIPNK